jgi:hypothetical protein
LEIPVLPFTAEQFVDVFAGYNEAFWPAPIFAYALAAIALAAALRGGRVGEFIVGAVLASFWLWTGIAYHWLFFTAINRVAWVFGAFFVAQGVLLLWFGLVRSSLRFGYRPGLKSAVGFLLIVYAAVVYPFVGYAAGYVYPRVPTFGITPCPVTIFTFGMLLLSYPVRLAVLSIPVLWSLIGGSAAFLLGVPQDWPLLLSGPLAVSLLWRDARAAGPAAS